MNYPHLYKHLNVSELGVKNNASEPMLKILFGPWMFNIGT